MTRLKETGLDVTEYGGKAVNLLRMEQLGLKVPPFVSISASQLAQAGSNESFATISQDVLANLPFKSDNTLFAVRSSGVSEDGQEHSFAGQFETLLNVKPDGLAQAIREVYASAHNERVNKYREERNILGDKSISIIVQQMIEPDVAGVAFGMHPVTGNRNEKVISSVYGLGEGLVSGKYNSDNFIIDEKDEIKSTLTNKPLMLALDSVAGAGTIEQAVALDKQDRASLNDAQVKEIKTVLDRLEAYYEHPQDIEFAYKNGELFLLQTRPITTVNVASGVSNEGEFIIWDNSNIVESYPGHSLPLGFSFIRKMYEAVYIQFSSIMGVSKKDIADNASVFANMLGLIKGRVYYNLLSWYKALALLPGYSLNAPFMEKMMGVKQRFELKDLPKRSKFRERIRVVNMVRIMLSNLMALPKMTKNFQAQFNEVMTEYNAIDFSQQNSWELMDLYKTYEQTLLKKWKAPLVNDFYAMIYFGTLQKLVGKYKLDESNTLHNNLLCGARDIVSTEPIQRCLRLATDVASDSTLKHKFVNESPEALYNAYLANAFPENIQQQIEEYIHKWGHRCVGELKLETITYKQNPAVFLSIIKTYVEQGISAKENNIDLEMRRAGETQVAERLKGKWLKKKIFNFVLKRTRRLVSNRENLRYERTRGYGVVREIFTAIGVNFADLEVIENARDIHYLTQEEIFDFIQGTSISTDLKPLVLLRKAEYKKFEESPKPAERIRTDGVVYTGNDLSKAHVAEDTNEEATEKVDDPNRLQGIGCCPGVIRKRVKIVLDPAEVKSLEGDILVTTSTDPGWVTLFPTASGILVEKGSLLSHSAIVSREMGIPCVVGIDHLLQKLKTGDLVEMDGTTGQVKIIGKSDEQ